ncbi:hypothetical protein T08_13971 [Trichinella sp. T8]|nr:hypothetical protein T08_12504 [Trichinella sp. T8]KRZ87363.1 hypothetical protein T08_13971 [Trichinella sp. T8]
MDDIAISELYGNRRIVLYIPVVWCICETPGTIQVSIEKSSANRWENCAMPESIDHLFALVIATAFCIIRMKR